MPKIEAFDFPPGRLLAGRYRIDGLLGSGWESEVYRVTELSTGIPRAAKAFYPHRNPDNRSLRIYANKLDRLRDCPIVIGYHHSETIRYRSTKVTLLISELVEGEILEDFVAAHPGKKLRVFEALHLLHELVAGLEKVHDAGEYHGDLHDRNVLVRRRGIGFDLKLLDLYHWGKPTRSQMREDLISLIRLLYDILGGRAAYARQPKLVKEICCGLRRDLILKRFPTAGRLRSHLENFSWDDSR